MTSKTHVGGPTEGQLKEGIDRLFQGDADCALFYFSGHGAISSGAGKGYLATPDTLGAETGLRLDYILKRAIESHPHIRSTVIILDCCNAGEFGSTGYSSGPDNPSELGKGVTLLAAADRNTAAVGDSIEGGMFSSLVINALEGAAADIRGRITPAAVYAHVDQFLDKWDQRPVYKANVKDFITLRRCAEKVPTETLLRLPEWFPTADALFRLCPECEPDPKKLPEEFHDVVPDPELVDSYARLQNCNRHGLVVPVGLPAGEEHMYYAAIRKKHCGLTELGKFYRRLAAIGRLE